MARQGKSPFDYVVVIRASGRLRFERNEQLRVHVDIEGQNCLLTFRTRYLEEGFESPIPRDLWIEASGKYKNLNSAVIAFTNAASFFTNVISFCTNGFGGECNFHLAFDNTLHNREREFFEQFISTEKGLPSISRKINPELCKYFIDALAIDEHGERLRRGINQYCLALESWTKGKETLANAHLYMGIEALVPVIRKLEMRAAGVDNTQQLANKWGIELKDLDSKIRREKLFQGDLDCHRDAKKASDGFEHGYLSYAEIRPLAERVRNNTSRYLRTGIIKLLDLPEEIENGLLSQPYIDPIGTEDYIRYLRGTITSDHDSLASEGNEYPIVEWSFSVSGFRRSPDGKLTLNFSQSLTPHLGDGVQFQPKSIELYGPEGIITERRGPAGYIDPEIIPASRKPDKRYIDFLRLLNSIETKSHEIGKGEPVSGDLRSVVLLHLISRCRSTFAAIVDLLGKQFGDESLLVYKSLVQDTTKLIFLHRNDSEIPTHIASYKHLSIDETKKLISIAKGQGYMVNSDDAVQNLNNQQKELESKLGIEPEDISTRLTSLLTCQPEFITDEAYWLYNLANGLSSGYLLPIPNRTREVENDLLHFESTTHDFDLLIQIGLHSSRLLVESHRSICSLFGWPGIQDLETALEKLKNQTTNTFSSA